MNNLKMSAGFKEEDKIIEDRIRALYDGTHELTILEAGCGRRWPLDLAGVKYKLIGVDLDEKALQSRLEEQKDLDEAIIADLQDFNLGGRQVDVIFNSFVLEHVENAGLMLDNFHKMLKPGGLLILRLPDRNTVFGFLTRITPFWFHVAYKKYVMGLKNAGKPGFAPYPTYYNEVVSREGIRDYSKKNGFIVQDEYGFPAYLQKKSLLISMVKGAAMCVSALSFGRLPWRYNNLMYVLSKDRSPAIQG